MGSGGKTFTLSDVFDALRRLFGPPPPATGSPSRKLEPALGYIVTFDESRISCRRPSGEMEWVAWGDLVSVLIETNDSGPWAADVLWLLVGRDGTGCVFPQGAAGSDELVEALGRRLAGFDFQQMIAAMSCVENRIFNCWHRTRGNA